jgi:hypothetical protein
LQEHRIGSLQGNSKNYYRSCKICSIKDLSSRARRFGELHFRSSKTKNGAFRMWLDSKELNKVTIKDPYPLTWIGELFDLLQESSYYSKIDLGSRYHQPRVRDEDVSQTAIRTRYGHYEF